MRRIFLPATMLAVLFATASAADAAALKCGDVVTGRVTLHADLLNCPGNGLVIGADGTRLNLAGHTISGSGRADTVGIDDSGGYGAIIGSSPPLHFGDRPVRGVVRGFGTGVKVVGRPFPNLAGVRVHLLDILDSTGTGLYVENSGSSRSLGIRAENNGGAGIEWRGSSTGGIWGNTMVGNGGAGLVLSGSVHNSVANNGAIGNGGDGVELLHGSSNNWLDSVSAIDNGGAGISIVGSSGNRVLWASERGNVGAGVSIRSADGNDIRRLDLRENGADGLFVDGSSGGTTIYRNSASGNADDGIDVRSAATKLWNNTAQANAALGINAVDGVVGRAPNFASGNGDPRECVGIVCV